MTRIQASPQTNLLFGLKARPQQKLHFSSAITATGDDVFCKMHRNEIPTNIIAENDSFYAVLDIDPVTPGQTVIASKRHIASENDLTDKEWADLRKILKECKEKLIPALEAKGLHPTGWNFGWDEGEDAGQAILHFHPLLVPRYGDDDKGGVRGVVPDMQFPSADRQNFGVFKWLFG